MPVTMIYFERQQPTLVAREAVDREERCHHG